MKAGYLSEFFKGVAIKKLSAVEADAARSHQHEYNGARGLVRVFGRAVGKTIHKALYIYLSDGDDEPVVAEGTVTWYDARESHPRRSEHRLYFPTTSVSTCAAEGDLLVVGLRPDNSVLVIIAQGDSTISNQIQWLFSIDLGHAGFSVREELETEQDRIHFASAFILEQLGIEVDAPSTSVSYLDTMLGRFGGAFPSTDVFSSYARSTVPELDARDDPDMALMGWMEREEILFRTLEKHLLGDHLRKGFADDVEGFIAFSLSVQNRRKSRVGRALENHLEVILIQLGLRYQRGTVTEGKSRPDFLFPGGREYRDIFFESRLLTMLGVKTTCKDRWRQVLTEANRIGKKHLLTLETAISNHQTDEMRRHDLSLVVPRPLHATYATDQRAGLLDISRFAEDVLRKQQTSGATR